MPRYSVSILARHDPETTSHCVESVLKYSQNFELILTDNGSTDGLSDYFLKVSKENTGVRVIRNDRNEGFSKPHTKAFEVSSGQYFIMLNNDAVVPPQWLQHLEAPLVDNPNAAISGPRGGCTFLNGHFVGGKGMLDYVEGACMMVRSDVIKKIGLFAPYLYFAYSEDADLCLRARKIGYTIHEANFVLHHVRGHTSKHISEIASIKEVNNYAAYPRWQFYLNSRKMDYPIVIRRDGAVGDVILTTAIAKALKEDHPQSPIYIETQVGEVYKNNPFVAGVLTGQPAPMGSRLVNLNMAYENLPHMHYLMAFQRAAWIERDIERKCYLYPSKDQIDSARSVITSGKWVAVHVGPSSWKGRDWPKERFEETCRILLRKGFKVVLIGLKNPGITYFTLDMCGKTSILQCAALVSQCSMVVTIDSAPMHIAQAMRIPVVGLFGVSLPQYCIADGSHCISLVGDISKAPCVGERHRHAGRTSFECDGACMRTIEVDHVISAVDELNENPFK